MEYDNIMSGYSFTFQKGDIVITGYGKILLRHENTLFEYRTLWIGMSGFGITILGYVILVISSVYCIIIPGIWQCAVGVRHYNDKMCNYNVRVWHYDNKI